MKRTVTIYGFSLAALVFVLKYLEYRLFVRDLSNEFYVGLVASSSSRSLASDSALEDIELYLEGEVLIGDYHAKTPLINEQSE